MSISACWQSTEKKLLWLGWFFMLVGLFLPVISIPVGDPHVGSFVMIFPVPHGEASGFVVAVILLFATLKSLGWLVYSIPILVGLLAPVLSKVESKVINVMIACVFAAGFLIPIEKLVFTLKLEELIESGFYVWSVGLLFLMVSRITACFSSTVDRSN